MYELSLVYADNVDGTNWIIKKKLKRNGSVFCFMCLVRIAMAK